MAAECDTSLDLAALVIALRQAGFRVDTRQFLTANELLLKFAARGERLEDDRARLLTHLACVLCTSKSEQQLFQRVFDSLGTDKGTSGGEQERQPDPFEGWRRVGRWLGPAAILIAAVLTLVGLHHRFYRIVEIPGQIIVEGGGAARDVTLILGDNIHVPVGDQGRFTVPLKRIDGQRPLRASLTDYTSVDQIIDSDSRSIDFTLRKPQPIPSRAPKSRIRVGPGTEILPAPFPPQRVTVKWGLVALSSLCLALALFSLWTLIVRLHRALVLRRMPIESRPEFATLPPGVAPLQSYDSQSIRAIASRLRRLREAETMDLDISASVASIARFGGLAMPVYAKRRGIPEYLALIERRSADDHQSRLYDDLVKRLRSEGVYLDRYYFTSDPRTCHAGDDATRPQRLADILGRHQRATLLLFTDADNCIDPATGRLRSWADRLRSLPRQVILSPESPYNWSAAESKLVEEGFAVSPATEAGLLGFAEEDGDWSLDRFFPATYARPYPPLLEGSDWRWFDRNAPSAATIEKLSSQLRKYLGATGFDLLCACAVYPEIHWSLTQELAGTLARAAGQAAVETVLPLVARLPWFRSGSMPDWLRRDLIARLPPDRAKVIQTGLERRLDRLAREALSGVRGGTAEGQRIAADVAARDVARTAPLGSALRDAVFLGFMSAGSIDAAILRAPAVLARLFSRIGLLPPGQSAERSWNEKARRVLGAIREFFLLRPQVVPVVVSLILGSAAIPAFKGELTKTETLRRSRVTALALNFPDPGNWWPGYSGDSLKGDALLEAGRDNGTFQFAIGKTDPLFAAAERHYSVGLRSAYILSTPAAITALARDPADRGPSVASSDGKLGSSYQELLTPGAIKFLESDSRQLIGLTEEGEVVLWEKSAGRFDSTTPRVVAVDALAARLEHTGEWHALEKMKGGMMVVTGIRSDRFKLDGEPRLAAMTPNAFRLFVATETNDWYLAEAGHVARLQSDARKPLQAMFDPRGRWFALLLDDGRIQVRNFDLVTSAVEVVEIESTERFQSLTVSGDGKSVVAGSEAVWTWPITLLDEAPPSKVDKPTIKLFVAKPARIKLGEDSTLKWSAANADNCTVSSGPPEIEPAEGSLTVSPSENTTYVLSCSGNGGETRASVRVRVMSGKQKQPAVVHSDPEAKIEYLRAVAIGRVVNLEWNATGNCTLAPNVGSVPASSARQVLPETATTFRLACSTARDVDIAELLVQPLDCCDQLGNHLCNLPADARNAPGTQVYALGAACYCADRGHSATSSPSGMACPRAKEGARDKGIAIGPADQAVDAVDEARPQQTARGLSAIPRIDLPVLDAIQRDESHCEITVRGGSGRSVTKNMSCELVAVQNIDSGFRRSVVCRIQSVDRSSSKVEVEGACERINGTSVVEVWRRRLPTIEGPLDLPRVDAKVMEPCAGIKTLLASAPRRFADLRNGAHSEVQDPFDSSSSAITWTGAIGLAGLEACQTSLRIQEEASYSCSPAHSNYSRSELFERWKNRLRSCLPDIRFVEKRSEGSFVVQSLEAPVSASQISLVRTAVEAKPGGVASEGDVTFQIGAIRK